MQFYNSIFYQMLSERGIEEYFDRYIEKDAYSVANISIHIVLNVINEIISQKKMDEATKYCKIKDVILLFHEVGLT